MGDIILLEAGSRIPADCIVIEATDLEVDEIFYHNGVPTLKKKEVCTAENIERNPDCFLLSQSLIMKGEGKAVVCCVGETSRKSEVENAELAAEADL